jgi:hypothetical protein
MNWLKNYAWLANWLSLPVMIIIAIIQGAKAGVRNMDLAGIAIILAFLSSIAVAFTPTFDDTARSFARYLVTFLIVVIIWDRKK